MISVDRDGGILRLDITDPTNPWQLSAMSVPRGEVFTLGLNPRGDTLATGNTSGQNTLWDMREPSHPRRVVVPSGDEFATHLAFSPDGNTLSVATIDLNIKLWDITTYTAPAKLCTLSPLVVVMDPRGLEAPTSATFSPDGRTLATAGWDETVILWNLADLRHPTRVSTLTGNHPDTGMYRLSFRPDSRLLATTAQGETADIVELWDIADISAPSLLSSIERPRDKPSAVAFSPTGYLLAAGGTDPDRVLWDVSNPSRPVATEIRMHHEGFMGSAVFSPDEHLMATTDLHADSRIMLWKL